LVKSAETVVYGAEGDWPGLMRNNIEAARTIAEARSADYTAALWADVPLLNDSNGRYATFPEIVGAAIVGRGPALLPTRTDLRRYQPPDFDPVAVEVITAWFLDYRYFLYSVDQVRVALLFGTDPVVVTPETGSRLAVSAAQFLSGYEEENAEKRALAAPLASLAIKEAMWGSPLPEEWI
jgi:hypothetical protein